MNFSRHLVSVLALLTVVSTGVGALTQAAEPPPQKPSQLLNAIKVQPDNAPDCSSLKSIVESVTRDCKTNDEKAIAIYNFCQLALYHRAYPSEPGGIAALKLLNCYGWGLCGGLHSVESALWREAGWEHRFVGWNGHTTVEAKYDGRWHYLDVFLKFYAWQPDGAGGRTIASQDDLTASADTLVRGALLLDRGRSCVYAKDNPFVMNGQKANWRAPAFLSCGDTIEDVIAGLKTHKAGGPDRGWNGIEHASGDYSTDVNLAPGWALTNQWDPVADGWYWADQQQAPAHTCSGHKDTRNDPGIGLVLEPYVLSQPARSYGTGRLTFTPDFSTADCLRGFAEVENVSHTNGALVAADKTKPASVTLKLQSPYILTAAHGNSAGAERVEASLDDGKTYQQVELKDFGAAVKGRTSALLRIGFRQALTSLAIEALVQNNPGSLPYLSPGKNVITVSAANPQSLEKDELVVTYAYQLGSRGKSFDELCDAGKEIAQQHNAQWSDKVTYVQRAFAANELPARVQIDCPTPAGRYPVYPRMLFVRRNVVSPGARPLPLPDGAVPADRAPGDTLASLPNPFLVGTEQPPVIVPRKVDTRRFALDYQLFCHEQQNASGDEFLHWPKNAQERGKVLRSAVIVGGELAKLPQTKIAAARLIVPVVEGHSMAPGKLGAVFLPAPLEKGASCDFDRLEPVAGTVVIPQQPREMPTYQPAKPLAIDVTRAVKELAAGRKFSGLALRIVPDRSIDDGYTVRCRISKTEPIVLEIDTYVDYAK